jgi:hypothetical protein
MVVTTLVPAPFDAGPVELPDPLFIPTYSLIREWYRFKPAPRSEQIQQMGDIARNRSSQALANHRLEQPGANARADVTASGAGRSAPDR